MQAAAAMHNARATLRCARRLAGVSLPLVVFLRRLVSCVSHKTVELYEHSRRRLGGGGGSLATLHPTVECRCYLEPP